MPWKTPSLLSSSSSSALFSSSTPSTTPFPSPSPSSAESPTLSPNVRSLVKSLGSRASDESVRDRVIHSLERIERHLTRRDPASLAKFYGIGDELNSNQNAWRRSRRRLNCRQKRQAQDQICMRLVEHIDIPTGVAVRSLLVPTPPDRLFTDDWTEGDGGADNFGDGDSFQWLDTNVSNAENCSRRAAAREEMRKSLANWIFLYFRVQRCNWERIVVTEKKSIPDVNMYAEEQINKWTMKLRFKMLRLTPVKVALLAFLSRMGLESNPGIIFCKDGFFGLAYIGNIYGNKHEVPSGQLSFNATPKFLNLKNGDSIFVSYCSKSKLETLEKQRLNYGEKVEDDAEEEGEGEWEEEGEMDQSM